MYRIETSRQLFERSKRSLAGGVNSNGKAAQKPSPLFFTRGHGARMYDVDGNEYIDYVLGWGPLLLGHTPPRVLEAVRKELDNGLTQGGQHELEFRLSEKLQTIIPCAELVTYNSTGTEAVLVALRLARAYTGKTKIVKFEGHYHGWADSAHVSTDFASLEQAGPRESPKGVLIAGQPKSVLEDVLVVPWNDLDLVKEVIQRHAHAIAAVITEPVMQRGVILPQEGYLNGLRQLCTENDILLIFDEVVTGFRLALGGAQEYFGVIPDLAIFSKAMGSGFPISCVAGKRDIMDLISSYEVLHAGTFSGTPVCLAAAYAVVNELEQSRGEVYRQLFSLGRQLTAGITEIGNRIGLNLRVQGIGPLFHVDFIDDTSITDYRGLLARDKERYSKFASALVERGILTLTNQGRWYISSAHTTDDIEVTLDTIEQVMQKSVT